MSGAAATTHTIAFVGGYAVGIVEGAADHGRAGAANVRVIG
jgi:hypothetical protein